MLRKFAFLAALAATPLCAGQPGVSVNVTDPPVPVDTVPTAQTVTVQCPETYYENETRTRDVTRTRWVPETFVEQETYTVRVPKTRMVPRTVTIDCCTPAPQATSVPMSTSVPYYPTRSEFDIPVNVRVGVDAWVDDVDDRRRIFPRLFGRRGTRGATQ